MFEAEHFQLLSFTSRVQIWSGEWGALHLNLRLLPCFLNFLPFPQACPGRDLMTWYLRIFHVEISRGKRGQATKKAASSGTTSAVRRMADLCERVLHLFQFLAGLWDSRSSSKTNYSNIDEHRSDLGGFFCFLSICNLSASCPFGSFGWWATFRGFSASERLRNHVWKPRSQGVLTQGRSCRVENGSVWKLGV